MTHYKLYIREKGNEHTLTPEYIGTINGNHIEFLTKFFGLNESIIESYKIFKIVDDKEEFICEFNKFNN